MTVNIKDSDNSPASATITLTINDDIPDANDDGVATTEGAAQIVTTAATGVLGNDDAGADHPGTVTGVSGGTIGTPIVTAAGTLTLYADGHYTYTPKASVPSGTVDSFTYTLTDADGDTDTAVLSFTFSGDNNVPTAGISATLVDEDNLASIGNGDAALGDDNPSSDGLLAHDYGLDGQGFIKLVSGSETVNGVLYTYTANMGGTQLIAYDGATAVFQVDLTNAVTGAYSVTLLSPVEHLGSNPGFEDNLDFHVSYEVYDADSNTALPGVGGTLTVTVDDDIPVLNIVEASLSVNENASTSGTWTLAPGADGVTSVDVTVGATTQNLLLSPNTSSTVFNLGAGVLTVYADGNYAFAAAAVTSNQNVTFSIKATDGDGDVTSNSVTITVNDVDLFPVGLAASGTVDDEGLNHGILGGTSDDIATKAWVSGTLTSTGGDGPVTYSFANLGGGGGTLGTEAVTYQWNGAKNTLNIVSAGRGTVAQVVVDPTSGAYTFALLKPVLNTVAAGENDNTLVLNFQVTDADNDQNTAGALTITLDDDAPQAFVAQSMKIENGANSVGSGQLNFFENIGADGGAATNSVVFTGTNGTALTTTGATAITSGGQAVTLYGFGTDTLTAKIGGELGTTVFTITLNPDADENLPGYLYGSVF